MVIVKKENLDINELSRIENLKKEILKETSVNVPFFDDANEGLNKGFPLFYLVFDDSKETFFCALSVYIPNDTEAEIYLISAPEKKSACDKSGVPKEVNSEGVDDKNKSDINDELENIIINLMDEIYEALTDVGIEYILFATDPKNAYNTSLITKFNEGEEPDFYDTCVYKLSVNEYKKVPVNFSEISLKVIAEAEDGDLNDIRFILKKDLADIGEAYVLIEGDVACLHSVLINEEYREMGFGRMLVNYSLNTAIDTYHVSNLILNVDSDNLPAVSLYESMGFKSVEVLRYYEI